MSVDEYSRCIRGQLCAHSLLNTQKNKIGGRAKSKQGRRCNKKLCREDGGSFCPVPGCVNDKGKRSCSCCTECKVEHAKWHADHASDMQTDAAGEATGGSEGGSPGALEDSVVGLAGVGASPALASLPLLKALSELTDGVGSGNTLAAAATGLFPEPLREDSGAPPGAAASMVVQGAVRASTAGGEAAGVRAAGYSDGPTASGGLMSEPLREDNGALLGITFAGEGEARVCKASELRSTCTETSRAVGDGVAGSMCIAESGAGESIVHGATICKKGLDNGIWDIVCDD